MLVSEVMHNVVRTISPNSSLAAAAQEMRDGDFGVLPVSQGEDLLGMITDRDIVTRAVAEGRDVNQTPVREAMTRDVLTCFYDDDVDIAAKLMSERQIRRLAVVDHEKHLVGVLSLGDLARTGGVSDDAGLALTGVSEPRHDDPGAKSQNQVSNAADLQNTNFGAQS